MKPIYLDYNATTPVDPRVAEAMLPYLSEHFGNPSSSHVFGRRTREAIERARTQVAELLACSPREIIFTSGGSESNNLAIKGVAEAHEGKGQHILTSAVEHPAVTEVCRHLESRGWRVDALPVDSTGLLDPATVEMAIDDRLMRQQRCFDFQEAARVEKPAHEGQQSSPAREIVPTGRRQEIGRSLRTGAGSH